MTKDKSETFSFLTKYDENYRLFKITGKGKYTLKELWDNIEIKSIEYFN